MKFCLLSRLIKVQQFEKKVDFAFLGQIIYFFDGSI